MFLRSHEVSAYDLLDPLSNLFGMAFLLAKKVSMTQRYVGDVSTPVTILAVSPCVVTQVRTQERDGYAAMQIATGSRKRVSRALVGHYAGRGTFARVRECNNGDQGSGVGDRKEWKVGETFDVTVFNPGDRVAVSATSKGKGFAGVIKRHHFHGQDATHGTKDQVRMPGSIAGMGRSRGGGVNRGQRMPGRMGGDRVTVRNLTVIAVDPVAGTLEVQGAVPGARGAWVEVRSYRGYWK